MPAHVGRAAPGKNMRRTVAAACLAGFVLLAHAARGEIYPDHAVRLVSPNPAGGANDTIVRIIAARMSPMLGAAIVIDNRGGGAGKIGAEVVAHAMPDGYTLLAGSVSTHSFAPITTAKLAYDPIKDFAPISLFALVQNVLVVPPKLPAADVRELVALVKANPGKLNYASGGPGSTSHFAVAMFVALAGIQNDTVHVPYKGGNPALMATMANEAQFYFGPIAGMVPFVEAGSVRALAVSGDARSPSLPNVPTMGEAGFPAYKAVSWFGLLAPAGTPPAIVDKLGAAVNQAVNDPEVASALRAQGIVPKSNRPAEFAAFIAEQLDLHRKLADEAGLKFEQ
jgi:tripartite-type tricarboxylate transporter receptor subunit TctC